jgi:hypothetical protein
MRLISGMVAWALGRRASSCSPLGLVFAFSLRALYLCLVADLSTYLRGDS